VRIFDASDDLDGTAAAFADLDVDVEHPLQALRLRLMAARRCAGVVSSGASAVRALLPLPRKACVTCARCALFGAILAIKIEKVSGLIYNVLNRPRTFGFHGEERKYRLVLILIAKTEVLHEQSGNDAPTGCHASGFDGQG